MRLAFLLLVATLLCGAAIAGPWVEKPGERYLRSSIAFEDMAGYSAQRTDIYSEIGLLPKISLVAKYETVSYHDASDFSGSGWRIALKRQLMSRGGFVLSTEAAVQKEPGLRKREWCNPLGLEGRVGVAWSNQQTEEGRFAFGELALRQHEGCQKDRIEIGIGEQTSKSTWSTTQLWIERSSSTGMSTKMQSELIWRRARFDVSIAHRQELSGRFQETAWVIAVASRF